jgi:hypothetical protein
MVAYLKNCNALKQVRNMSVQKIKALGFVGLMALGLTASQAQAVIDITAVTTGISDAQTAVLAIITSLLALSVAIFGLSKVYRFVSRKAGA